MSKPVAPVLCHPALSPDGQVLAFQFHGGDARRSGIGLYRLRSGHLIRIPNPPQGWLAFPSFSRDGTRLVAVRSNDVRRTSAIVSIDLRTRAIETVGTRPPDAGSLRFFPVVQPETGNILYVDAADDGGHRLRRIDVQTGTDDVLIGSDAGYSVLFRPFFTDRDTLYVQGIGGQANGGQDGGGQDGGPPDPACAGRTDLVSYRLRPGQAPAIAFPELEAQRAALAGDDPVRGLTGAAGADMLIGVAADLTHNSRGRADWSKSRIVRVDQGRRLEALAHLHGHVLDLCLADDGSVAAFLMQGRGMRGDRTLMILELRSGAVRETGLPARLAAMPAFTPPSRPALVRAAEMPEPR
ncbi:TolB family protein [Oleisolibacter albus]|uniref:TolB family protein n=1 Tax=Oleisolibacter albus TaxID=2171757 RepID=UPI0012D7517D|nr:hypothetical protein [Oleisolibacter albus]